MKEWQTNGAQEVINNKKLVPYMGEVRLFMVSNSISQAAPAGRLTLASAAHRSLRVEHPDQRTFGISHNA